MNITAKLLGYLEVGWANKGKGGTWANKGKGEHGHTSKYAVVREHNC